MSSICIKLSINMSLKYISLIGFRDTIVNICVTFNPCCSNIYAASETLPPDVDTSSINNTRSPGE